MGILEKLTEVSLGDINKSVEKLKKEIKKSEEKEQSDSLDILEKIIETSNILGNITNATKDFKKDDVEENSNEKQLSFDAVKNASISEISKKIEDIINDREKKQGFFKSIFEESKTVKDQLYKTEVLDDKVEEFLNWYEKELAINKYEDKRKLKDFIEKFAVLYELEYPDYEILDFEKISSYQSFDTTVFFEAESKYLEKPKYPKIIRYNNENGNKSLRYTFYLNDKGYVESTNFDGSYSGYIEPLKFEGKHINEVKTILEEKFDLTEDDEIVRVIENHNAKKFMIESLLNSIMYRIIERGNGNYGAKRALIFATEFKRNIDIPIIYGIDLSDPDLEEFITGYLEMGGNENLPCYIDYSKRESKYEKLKKIPLKEVLDLLNNQEKNSKESSKPILSLNIYKNS